MSLLSKLVFYSKINHEKHHKVGLNVYTGTGQNCKKTKLHEVTKVHERTKLHENKFDFIHLRFLSCI